MASLPSVALGLSGDSPCRLHSSRGAAVVFRPGCSAVCSDVTIAPRASWRSRDTCARNVLVQGVSIDVSRSTSRQSPPRGDLLMDPSACARPDTGTRVIFFIVAHAHHLVLWYVWWSNNCCCCCYGRFISKRPPRYWLLHLDDRRPRMSVVQDVQYAAKPSSLVSFRCRVAPALAPLINVRSGVEGDVKQTANVTKCRATQFYTLNSFLVAAH